MKNKMILGISLFALCCSVDSFGQNFTFKGRVIDNMGKGLAHVVVNDGSHFTQTDSQGRWELKSDTTMSKFVSLSTPANCMMPETEGLSNRFYISVNELVINSCQHDFVLTKRTHPCNAFYYIAVADPQVQTEADMIRWRNETIPDMFEVIDSLKDEREVVGMTLGDLVYDNMNLYDAYKTSLKNSGAVFHQCIGNHDFDKQYQDLHNMSKGSATYGEMVYNKYFGPTDYSFNIGDVHIITMKDINYVGQTKYIEALTGEQLEWLKKDLSYVPKGKLVILNMHAPSWNRIENSGNIRNAKDLQEVLKNYNVHVFSGHTHYSQNNIVSSNLYEHNIGTACGIWWKGCVNQCGAPNGYMIVDVSGNSIKWHYKATRKSCDYQFRIYKKGELDSHAKYVVANVWDWDSLCRVKWYQDGKDMGDMQQFIGVDPEYSKFLNNTQHRVKTDHLFRAMPSDSARQIRIEFTNRFGEKYNQTIIL